MTSENSCFRLLGGGNATTPDGTPYHHYSYQDDGTHDGHALKPCPFCGSTRLLICNTTTPYFWVECQECYAQCPGDGGDEPDMSTPAVSLAGYRAGLESAVDAWNWRPR